MEPTYAEFAIGRSVTLLRTLASHERAQIQPGTVGNISAANWISQAHIGTEFYINVMLTDNRSNVVQLLPSEQGSTWQFSEPLITEAFAILRRWQRKQSPLCPLLIFDPTGHEPRQVEIAVVDENLLFADGSITNGKVTSVPLSRATFHFFATLDAARRHAPPVRFLTIGSPDNGFLLIDDNEL